MSATAAPPTEIAPRRPRVDVAELFSSSTVAGPLVSLILAYALFAVSVDNFLTWRTASGILSAATILGIVTVGVTLLMIGGQFDLSVGPQMALGGYLFGQNIDNPLWALVLAIGAGVVFGGLNGVIVVTTRIPSFIVTLGTLAIYTGFVWVFVSGGTVLEDNTERGIYNVLNGRFGLVNDALPGANFRTGFLWLLAIVVIGQWALYQTPFGNRLLASGGDRTAAVAQGTRPDRITVTTYAITGALATFAGVLVFSQFQFAQVSTGQGTELNAIAAAVVGGTLLIGGLGSVWGALVGVLLISTLRSGVVLMNLPWIPADNFDAVVGIAIVVAVALNYALRKRLL